jgi:diadenosine tetraphosphate (Ap4A) HIT family hydrolase
MYVKELNEDERIELRNRNKKVKELQNKDICFSCQNFETGDIFPDEGLIFYEDEKVRCQFEKFPRATGQIIIVAKDHYEDISEMPLELGTHILKISDAIIRLQKKIIGAEKVYMCTICDGKRNHLHFQLLPRLKGEPIGYKHFVREEGIIKDYHETSEIFKSKMEEMLKSNIL